MAAITKPDQLITKEIKTVFQEAWSFELFKVDGQSITIVNLLIAISLFMIGMNLASKLSVAFKRKILGRFKVEMNLADLIEKAVYYFLIIIVTLLVLDVAHVPLTVFTLIGGALALGVGLGSQNILNNFISGLILMLERSIRIGDIIEFDNKSGTVLTIGARCTQVRTYNNFVILIPNGKLLDSSIANLTLHDSGRVYLSTQIALNPEPYFSNAEITATLLEAALTTKHVAKEPAPQVFLVSMNDGNLQYEIFYWTNISSAVERRRVLSDINAALLGAIHARGIALRTAK